MSTIKHCTTNRETLAEDLEWYILSYIEKCARVQDLEELFTVMMPLHSISYCFDELCMLNNYTSAYMENS